MSVFKYVGATSRRIGDTLGAEVEEGIRIEVLDHVVRHQEEDGARVSVLCLVRVQMLTDRRYQGEPQLNTVLPFSSQSATIIPASSGVLAMRLRSSYV